MSTEYGRFTDRNGNTICIDAQGIVKRLDISTPEGKVLVSLSEENYETFMAIMRIAASQHLGWDE
jgi:hypothetical protein